MRSDTDRLHPTFGILGLGLVVVGRNLIPFSSMIAFGNAYVPVILLYKILRFISKACPGESFPGVEVAVATTADSRLECHPVTIL